MAVSKPITILYAEDDEEDRTLVLEAMRESRLGNHIVTVSDGEELLEYLQCKGRYSGRAPGLPGLILLDLNMPRLDGREALREIKADADLRRIPVIVLTTSRAEEDILRTYDLGISSFIVKPVTFDSLVDTVRTLDKYWLEIVELPVPRQSTGG
ncbi:MAG: response regulator [bacterium]|nr:response regulator [bacterium]